MSSKAFISLIIPCYNVAPYLEKGLEELANLEDLNKTELIFIDDGSSDNTINLLNDYATKIPQAKIIAQKNQGVSAARNAGLEIASGQYILFLDGDDFLTSTAIKTIKNQIRNADILLTPITCVPATNNTKRTGLMLKEGNYSVCDLYKACPYFPTLPMLVYRTDIIKQHHIRFAPDIHVGEVYTFTCEYLYFCDRIQVSHESFYLYNIRPSSATHAHNFNKDLTILTAVDRIIAKSDPAIAHLPSFTRTLFMLCAFFTYNKYAKLGLKNQQAIEIITKLLHHTNFLTILKETAFAKCQWNRDKLLAIYIYITRLWGYKLLATIFSISSRRK